MLVALTCDDAPTIAGQVPSMRDPTRMDRLRVVLSAHGVSQCVAFVVGAEAEAEPAPLRRWLAAGYELGNHTHEHLAASAVGPARFVDSIVRCHQVLEDLGSFERSTERWFRFPCLDYGADREARERIRMECRKLGYRVAHASADLHDHRFELALARAMARDWAWRREAIGARYRTVATRSLERAQRRLDREADRSVKQVTYFHCGPVSELFLGNVLADLRRRGVSWCSLGEALRDPRYASFDVDPTKTGLVSDDVPRSLRERLVRRLAHLGARINVLDERLLGPRWPHLG